MALRKFLALLLTIALPPVGMPAQSGKKSDAPNVTITKAPPETPEQFAARKLALQEMLQRLTTTGRIMQVVAHPDDEDGAMLTLESRVKGNTAMLFTFTRGEGGQNAQGAVFFDELGILRTLELLAADKEYGAEERFSHVADFGFSKSAEESFQKWGGEDVPEGDLVRAIREFQPDVLVARFSGTPRDGHGHHVASALMTIKAFHDVNLLNSNAENFDGWQPSKLYTGLAEDKATLVPDENQPSPLLEGKTPAQVAVEGLRFQQSQGLGNLQRSGPLPKRYSSYKLVATANGAPMAAQETDFFHGIDTSLPGLVDRFLEEAARLQITKQQLAQLASTVAEAAKQAGTSPDNALPALEAAMAQWGSLHLNAASGPLALRLRQKYVQLKAALQLAAGFEATLTALRPDKFVTRGEEVPFHLHVANRGSEAVVIDRRPQVEGDVVTDCVRRLPAQLMPGMAADVECTRRIPRDAAFTRAPFFRESPVKDSVYKMREGYDGWTGSLPFSSITETIAWASGKLQTSTNASARVFIAPPVSVAASPASVLRRLSQPHEASVHASAQDNGKRAELGELLLQAPKAWRAVPPSKKEAISAGATAGADFALHWPQESSAMQATVGAAFTSEGQNYSENYYLVSRRDLPDAFPYYAPAQTTVSLINAEIPERHNIGYIMGAGDTLPDDLRSLGFDVHLLTESDLATGDLAQYGSIMTGVRAYAIRADLRAHNQRLLDYVKQGGTFVVQYEQDYNAFNQGHYTPYPATMGRDRVSQEEQPVKILDPESSILRYPNRITNADFDNWVQERGLYFMKEWSPDYMPLLSMNDIGEPPLEGGLLVAHYGKGTYIYTGLSFYRELPNGVPGAARLLINLLAAGHNPAEQPTVNALK